MTSVSQIKLYDDGEEVDHSFRKIAQGYRRQYIDCSTSAQKLCHVDVADIQTDHYPIATAENQTLQEMKEINVQTLSKCELCHQQIQFSASSSALIKNQFQCATCPAFIQLFKGMSCSKCATGMMQMSRQNRQQQTQQAKLDKEMMKGRNPQFMKRKISGEMLTSGQQQDSKVGGCSSMITKLTVASYCVPPEKTHISSQTASKTKNNEERSKKLITLNRNNKKRIKIKGARTSPSSKTSQQSSRSQIIENGNKVIEIGSGNSISIVVTPGNDSRSVETMHRIVNIGCKNNSHPSSHPNQMEIVERLHEMEDGNKRGTLQFTAGTTPNKRAPIEKQIQITSQCQGTCDAMHLELATINSETGTAKNPRNQGKNPAMRQSRIRKEKLEKLQQTELINRRENEAQTVDDFETLPRGKRTYAKALRKNKVKPADASVSDISITLVPASNPPSTPSIRKNKKLGLQNSVSLHEKYINVCPICKRLQIPMKGPPFQYYSVNKDKRGRFYCDTCAPPASIKVSFKRTDQQRLKCCQCGNYLRIKNSQTTRNKSDHCPHCDLSLSRHHISST
ncbi:uncharacterized protein LOC122719446 [Apis laboriosa]|uniref:uncharacterized protein LOC122719446 n=1 Tax=Apis laboriosa TaxID=183418 RepID=UPI001CC65796|nr:uncharacterized protein LOC122719446 [Apis laboriosa]